MVGDDWRRESRGKCEWKVTHVNKSIMLIIIIISFSILPPWRKYHQVLFNHLSRQSASSFRTNLRMARHSKGRSRCNSRCKNSRGKTPGWRGNGRCQKDLYPTPSVGGRGRGTSWLKHTHTHSTVYIYPVTLLSFVSYRPKTFHSSTHPFPYTCLVNVGRPWGEDEITYLLVEGKPLDVHITHRSEHSVGQQLTGAVMSHNDVGVDEWRLVTRVGPAWVRVCHGKLQHQNNLVGSFIYDGILQLYKS